MGTRTRHWEYKAGAEWGSGYSFAFSDGSYRSRTNGPQLASGEYPSGTVTITAKWLHSSGRARRFSLWLNNYDDSQSVQIGEDFELPESVTYPTTITRTATVSKPGMAGQKLYFCIYDYDKCDKYTRAIQNVSIDVTTYYPDSPTPPSYTRVNAGDKIVVANRSQTGTTTTQGAVISDTHFSAGDSAAASTFNSRVLGIS